MRVRILRSLNNEVDGVQSGLFVTTSGEGDASDTTQSTWSALDVPKAGGGETGRREARGGERGGWEAHFADNSDAIAVRQRSSRYT